MGKSLIYDDSNMLTSKTGNGKMLKTIKDAPFFALPYDVKGAEPVLKIAKTVKSRFKQMIVVGMGGSELGTRAIWQALGRPERGVWLEFANNPDPEDMTRFLGRGDQWKQTAINVVSKSGNTLETLAIFFVLRRELIRAVGEKKHAQHIFVTTHHDEMNPLYRLATEHGYTVIEHADVGGRFSVLSSVGLFPSACAGVDIKKLLAGAREVQDEHRRRGAKHPAAHFATLLYTQSQRGRGMHVLMPYASQLAHFGQWYRQLWAESLNQLRGKETVGPTPIVALGTMDQHSQIQMFNEGAQDKVVTFLEVAKFRSRVVVPTLKSLPRKANNLCAIMHASLEGTRQALTKHGRPNGTLRIPEINEKTLGALFQFYELSVAYLAQLYGINPYVQPGVEEGKRITKELLEG